MSIGWLPVAESQSQVPTGFWLRVRDLDGVEREACCKRLDSGSFVWWDREGNIINEPDAWLWCGW